MRTTIQYLGCAGHFICADRCRWRLHAEVIGPHGAFRVSGVGDMWTGTPPKREALGAWEESWYEVFVFKLSDALEAPQDCLCHKPSEWHEIDGGRYANGIEATNAFDKLVKKYAAIARAGKGTIGWEA